MAVGRRRGRVVYGDEDRWKTGSDGAAGRRSVGATRDDRRTRLRVAMVVDRRSRRRGEMVCLGGILEADLTYEDSRRPHYPERIGGGGLGFSSLMYIGTCRCFLVSTTNCVPK